MTTELKYLNKKKKKKKKIIRENRFCHLCSRRELGDEYHYIFERTKFINEKKT